MEEAPRTKAMSVSRVVSVVVVQTVNLLVYAVVVTMVVVPVPLVTRITLVAV